MEDLDQVVEDIVVPLVGFERPQVWHAEPLEQHLVRIHVGPVGIVDADLRQIPAEVPLGAERVDEPGELHAQLRDTPGRRTGCDAVAG